MCVEAGGLVLVGGCEDAGLNSALSCCQQEVEGRIHEYRSSGISVGVLVVAVSCGAQIDALSSCCRSEEKKPVGAASV